MTGCAFLEDDGRLGVPVQARCPRRRAPATPAGPQTHWAASGSLPLRKGASRAERGHAGCWGLGQRVIMSPRQCHPCLAGCPGEGQLTGGTLEVQNNVQKWNSAALVFSKCPYFSDPVLPSMTSRKGVYCPLSMWVCCIPWSFLTLQQHFQSN